MGQADHVRPELFEERVRNEPVEDIFHREMKILSRCDGGRPTGDETILLRELNAARVGFETGPLGQHSVNLRAPRPDPLATGALFE